jgi:hypothetical protein
MEPTLVTETSEVKAQTPGKFPEESTLQSQRGENLKTKIKTASLISVQVLPALCRYRCCLIVTGSLEVKFLP